MQVSWIDEVRLKELLHELREATPPIKAGPLAWEVHTLPEAPPEKEPAGPSFVTEGSAAAGVDETFESPTTLSESQGGGSAVGVGGWEEEEEQGAAPVITPEIERIRDRLKAIRERALQAGLLSRPTIAGAEDRPTELADEWRKADEGKREEAPVPEFGGPLESEEVSEAPPEGGENSVYPMEGEPGGDDGAAEQAGWSGQGSRVEEPPAWTEEALGRLSEIAPPAGVFQRVDTPFSLGSEEVAAIGEETVPVEGGDPTGGAMEPWSGAEGSEIAPEPTSAEVMDGAVAEEDRFEEDGADGFYFEVPLGTVVERLDAFAGWAQKRFSQGELMLVDEHGDLLWGAQARAGVVLSTLLASRAMSRSSAAVACTTPLVHTQSLSEDLQLSVVSCPTRVGVLYLAILQRDALPEQEAELLKQALQSSIDVTG